MAFLTDQFIGHGLTAWLKSPLTAWFTVMGRLGESVRKLYLSAL